MAAATITINNTGQTVTNNPVKAPDSPAIDLHKITKVYFAKKIVSNSGQNVDFARIDSLNPQGTNNYDCILGMTVYLIIETINMKGLKIDIRIIPTGTSMTGNLDPLSLLIFNPTNAVGNENETQSIIVAEVGNNAALNNNLQVNTHYINLKTHETKAIVKLQLRPSSRQTFNEWATNIADTVVALKIDVNRNDLEPCAYGEASTEEIIGRYTFLNSDADGRFRIANRYFYTILHADNSYNFLSLNGTVRPRIGKIENEQSSDVHYFYYDKYDNQLFICNAAMHVTKEKNTGTKPTALPTNQTIISDNMVTEGQTNRRIIYANGNIAEHGSNNGKTFWVLYTTTGNDTQLVRMPDSLTINELGIIVNYTFSNSQRRYTNPNSMAGFIGGLAQCGYIGVVTTGSCFREASCFPSVAHVNGRSVDTQYLPVRANEQNLITAFFEYGFNNQITGNHLQTFTNATREGSGTLHDTHLHSGFNIASVQIINQ